MKIKVMAVDDEADILTLVCRTLEQGGMETMRAKSADECLDMLKQGKAPDVILLDIMMPGKDGFAACREIKSSPVYKDIIVIMLTAKSQNRDQVDSYKCGADGYIAKPFDPKALVNEVRSFVNLKEGI